MKRKYKILILLSVLLLTISFTAIPAFALTESEVQNQVNAIGKEAVTGNIFVWFLCAIAFLKVSQKIDSFMSSLGINVGHTGGSMLAEAMIAMRGVGAAKSFSGGRGGGGGSSGSSGGGNTFLKGGLSGVVSRKVTNNAINNANGSKSGGLGGMAFNSSLNKGGGFANSVIGKIATGNMSSTGSISGENAANSLMSYMGYTALGKDAEDVPSFSDVEIGGGHIFATETSAEHPEGIANAVEQYDALVQSAVTPPDPNALRLRDLLFKAQMYQKGDIQFTPKQLAEELVSLACINERSHVLEPEAGVGNIADAAKEITKNVDCIERMAYFREILKMKKHNVIADDLLETESDPVYDAAIMNPPFSEECEHIRKAFDFVRPGGNLVAVCSSCIQWKNNRKYKQFRDWLSKHTHFVTDSNTKFEMTDVDTVILVMKKAT